MVGLHFLLLPNFCLHGTQKNHGQPTLIQLIVLQSRIAVYLFLISAHPKGTKSYGKQDYVKSCTCRVRDCSRWPPPKCQNEYWCRLRRYNLSLRRNDGTKNPFSWSSRGN